MTWCEKADAMESAESKLNAVLDLLEEIDEASEIYGYVKDALEILKPVQREVNRQADDEHDEEMKEQEREYWCAVL